MAQNCVLLTGANGYLGKKILGQLLEKKNMRVIAAVRASSQDQLRDKYNELCDGLDRSRIEVIACDLTQENPLRLALGLPITHIVHTAADTRFNITAEVADRLNRDGSRKVYEFARTLPRLQSLVYLSSIYSCGLNEGVVPEAPLQQSPDFANHYERSKFESELILISEFSDLPWKILRTATVIADNAGGCVRQSNVFHNTAGLIYHGLISVLPGDPLATIYFVDADPVAKNCVELCLDSEPYSVRHLCYPKAVCMSLQTIIDTLMAGFGSEESFRARRIFPPLLTDLPSFYAIADVVDRGFTGLILKQSVESIKPFAPQLYSQKDFTVTLPDFNRFNSDDFQRELLGNTVQHLIHSVWRSHRKAAIA